MVNGEKTGVLGNFNNVPDIFDVFPVGLDLLVLENEPFDIYIGRPTLKKTFRSIGFPEVISSLILP